MLKTIALSITLLSLIGCANTDYKELAKSVDTKKAQEAVNVDKLSKAVSKEGVDFKQAADSVDTKKAGEAVDVEKAKAALGK